MQIQIAERLRPFSHQFGARCLLPGSDKVACIYPAFAEFKGERKIIFPIQGPVKRFSSTLNLDTGKLTVFGHYQSGYYKEDIFSAEKVPIFERVSFGCHKAQNWEAMRQRGSMAEWLPHWHRMAQWKGDITRVEVAAEDTLLGQCQRVDRFGLEQAVKNLFEGSFEDYFVPTPERWEWLGLGLPPTDGPCPLVQGAALLRSALIRSEGENLHFLPKLPQGLVCGRYIDAKFPWGTVHFEWTKGLLRRAVLVVSKTVTIQFHFQKELENCRLRKDGKEQVFNNNAVQLEERSTYYLDHFQK